MKSQAYLKLSTGLTAAGVLFSGYLSGIRVTSGVCAFAEPCPFFLGHPACYTGFAFFSTLFMVSAIGLVLKTEAPWPAVTNTLVSTGGMVFAAAMALPELVAGHHYKMGLPTCAYGFVFFAAVFIASLSALVGRLHLPRPPLASHGGV